MAVFTMALTSGWAVQGLVLLMLASLACLALWRASAAARHAVWSAALIGMLLLPVLSMIVPALQLPIAVTPTATLHPDSSLPADSAEGLLLAFAPSSAGAVRSDADATKVTVSPVVPASAESPFGWSVLVPAVWLAGALLLITLYGCGVRRVRRLLRDSQPFSGPLDGALRNCAAELELRCEVRGRLTDERIIPLTFGYAHPVVLLPAEAAAWPPARLRMVLLHELAHVERRDCLVQCLSQLACAAHWFNPLAWFALVRLRVEQERACDDVVLVRGAPADDYAAELLRVTAGSARFGTAGVVALAVGRAGRMERRVRDLLDVRRNRGPLSRRRAVSLVAATAATVSLIAALSKPVPSSGADDKPVTGADGTNGTSGTVFSFASANTDDSPPATDSAPSDAQPSLSTDSVRDLILKSTLQDVTAQDLTEAAIRGMLESLHAPHSQLVVGDDLQFLKSEPQAGIGAQLTTEGDAIVVITPLPGSPALTAGVKPGDTILAIDGQQPGDLQAAVKTIRGMPGTDVKLRLRGADGTERELSITRGTFAVSSVQGLDLDADGEWHYWLSHDDGLAYVRLAKFGPGAREELASLLGKLGGLRGLVLDLRRCPGGFLPEGLGVANLFVTEGELLTIQGRQHAAKTFSAEGTAPWPELPLIVLADGTTASAGEVLAGALQARGRAVILGERTFGKGTVEQLFPLETPQTALKLTIAEMRLPGGRAIQRIDGNDTWGVDPTDGYYVPVSKHERELWSQRRSELEVASSAAPELPVTSRAARVELGDPQLGAAIDALTARVRDGEFRPTGRPLAELTTDVARREQLRASRTQLQQELNRIERELEE